MGAGQPVLSLIQVFHQEMLETEVKQELLVENYKKSLTGQFAGRVSLLYYLLTIDKNFVTAIWIKP